MEHLVGRARDGGTGRDASTPAGHHSPWSCHDDPVWATARGGVCGLLGAARWATGLCARSSGGHRPTPAAPDTGDARSSHDVVETAATTGAEADEAAAPTSSPAEDVASPPAAEADGPKVLAAFADAIAEAGPLTKESFRAAATKAREVTGIKGKALFHPIRVALTGMDSGPELDLAIPAIDVVAGLMDGVPSCVARVRGLL